MSSKTVALGIVIGASLGRGYFSVFDSAKIRADKLGQAFAETNKKLAATRDVEKYRQQLVKLQAEQQKTGQGAKDIQKVSKALEKAEATAKKYGLSLGDIAKQQRQLAVESGKLGRAIQYRKNADNAQQNLSDSKGRLLGVVGAAYSLVQPIKQAIEFETAMLGVAKQVDGARDASGKLTTVYTSMRKEIQMLGRELPIANNELAVMVEAGARMGVAKENLIGFTRTAAIMASAFDLPAAELADNMGKIANLYKIPIPAIGELGDTINYLDDKSIAKGGDIISFLTRVGGVAASVKITSNNMAALGSTLLTLGEQTETAGTATNAIFQILASAESGTKDFWHALHRLKLSAKDIQKGMQIDAQGTFLKVLNAINKMPKDQRLGILSDLVGREHSDTLAKLASGIDEYRKQIDLANSQQAKGSMSKEFSARMQTTAAQLKLASNHASELGVSFGTVFLPALNTVLKPLSSVASWASGVVEKYPTISYLIGGIAGGFIAYGAALTTVTAIQWAFNAAMAANPIGIVVSGVAAFAALAYTVYENWAPISLWIGERVFTPIASAADNLKTLVGNAFAEAASTVKALWEPVMTWFAEKFAWIGQSIAWVKDIFNQSANASMRPVGATQKSPFGATASATAPLPGNIATPKWAQNVNTHNNTTINVQQKPGENSQDLAKRVAAEIKRQENSDKRRALHD